MSTLSIRMPDSLHAKLKKLSKKDRVSLNQFITSTMSKKITAMETENYIVERSKRGSLEKYHQVLSNVSEE